MKLIIIANSYCCQLWYIPHSIPIIILQKNGPFIFKTFAIPSISSAAEDCISGTEKARSRKEIYTKAKSKQPRINNTF